MSISSLSTPSPDFYRPDDSAQKDIQCLSVLEQHNSLDGPFAISRLLTGSTIDTLPAELQELLHYIPANADIHTLFLPT